MKLKKLTALFMAVLLVFGLCACGVQNWQGNGEGENVSSEPEIKAEDYEDNLSGLCAYLTALELCSGDAFKMEAKIIGAKEGVKYSFNVSNMAVTLEIYEYDLENTDETGKAVLESVKNNGSFTLLNTEVKADLSDNGKYLIIFGATKEKDEVKAAKEAILAAVKSF